MIKTAETYLGLSVSGKLDLMDDYNFHCAMLVKPSRRYRIKSGDNWCAAFVSVVAYKSGYNLSKFPVEVSVGEQVKLARSRDMFTQNVERAKIGDLIIFNWNGGTWPDHVGIIKSIIGNVITTIEGNYKGTVGNRNIEMNSKFIYGIINL